MKSYYFSSGLETDFEYKDDMKTLYESFCGEHHFAIEPITNEILFEKFQIRIEMRIKYRLEAQKHLLDLDNFSESSSSFAASNSE